MTTTKKNLLLNTIYNFLILAYPLLMAPYISRVLGAEGLGIYNYSYSVAQYFVIFAMLGLNNYGNRSVSMVRDDKEKLNEVFNSIFLMQLITSLISFVAYIVFVVLFIKVNKAIFIIQTLFVVSALFDVNWLLFGLEKFELTIFRNMVVRVMSLILVFIFVRGPHALVLYTVIMSACLLLSQLIMWESVRKLVKIKMPRLSSCLVHIRPNLLLFLPVVSVSVFQYMSKIMLGLMGTMVDVGLYENADKTVSVTLSLVTAFNTVMMPKISNLVAKGETERIQQYISKSMQIIMLMSGAIAFGVAAIAPEFTPFYFGEEFSTSANLIIFFAPSIVLSSVNGIIRTHYLIPYMKEAIYTSSLVAGAVVNLISNLLLIGAYGALGAVIGTILAKLTVTAYQIIATRKDLPYKEYLLKNIPYIIFGLVMLIAVRLVAYFYTGATLPMIILEVIVGATIYMLLCLLYLLFTKDKLLYELNGFRLALFRKKRNSL